MDQKKQIRVVCALIEHEGKVLAAKRAYGQAHAGAWEFPGGKIGAHERPEDALVREIAEELGVTIKVGNPLVPVVHEYDSFSVELMPYICEITDGRIQPVDHDEIRWISRKSNLDIELLPPDREIWKDYLKKCRI